jgi:hypothetical protein
VRAVALDSSVYVASSVPFDNLENSMMPVDTQNNAGRPYQQVQ